MVILGSVRDKTVSHSGQVQANGEVEVMKTVLWM